MKGLILFFGIISFAVTTYLYLEPVIEGRAQDVQFEGAAMEHATGSIKKIWVEGGRMNRMHFATFGYPYGDDQYEEVTSEITVVTYQQLHVGDTVPVKFPINRPNIGRIDLPSENLARWIRGESGWVLWPLFVLLGFFLIWMRIPESRSSWEKAAVDMESSQRRRDE